MNDTLIPQLTHCDRHIEGEPKDIDLIYQVQKILYDKQSKYQDIKIYQTKALGRVLVLDGITQLSESDEFIYHEMFTHTTLQYLDSVTSVLVIGAGDGGILREVEKYSEIKKIVLCEIDEDVISVTKEYLPFLSKGTFEDPRLEVVTKPAEEYIKQLNNASFDAIIIDSTDYEPGNSLSELLFGHEFYNDVFRVLSPNGVVSTLTTIISPGTSDPLYFKKIIQEVRSRMEKFVPASYVHWYPTLSYSASFTAITIAQKNTSKLLPSIESIQSKFKARNISTKYYSPYMHVASCIDPIKDYKSIYK